MKTLLYFILLLLCCGQPAFAKNKGRQRSPVVQQEEPLPVPRFPSPETPYSNSDRITLFENTVTVKQDGTLHVVEKIHIYNGNGVDMQRPDIPPDFEAAGGKK